ncbi:MAG: bacterioferritin-associated ferredoxin [Gammaproteobacteria bacterium]|nr:bacterioferritin-associated ferredoxin [Gammaproteobacteria bacterium]
MYVCICNAVTDSTIREEARSGCCSLRELSQSTGCGTTCGKCARQAREILAEEMAAQQDASRQQPPAADNDDHFAA